MAWDAIQNQGAMTATRLAGLLILIVAGEVLGLVGAGLLWLLPLSRPDFLKANYRLQAWWTGALFHGARRILGFRLKIEGLEDLPHGPFLLLVRHTSWADTVLAAALIANPRRLRLRYVLKRELLWGPCLDVVGQRLPNLFVDRSGHRRERELQAIRELARGIAAGEGLLIYPEGTRFSSRKLDRELQRVAKQNPEFLPLAQQFRSVLPPRLGGILNLLQECPELDVVILGHVGMENLKQLVKGSLRVKLWHYNRADLPSEGLAAWVFQRWAELDQWVNAS